MKPYLAQIWRFPSEVNRDAGPLIVLLSTAAALAHGHLADTFSFKVLLLLWAFAINLGASQDSGRHRLACTQF